MISSLEHSLRHRVTQGKRKKKDLHAKQAERIFFFQYTDTEPARNHALDKL
jgi:hypothetical protein